MLLLPIVAFSQGENNNWTFGYYNGLNFNSGTPEFFEGSNFSNEGSASISDPLGNLLFYSNGQTIWDRNHNPMPNGEGLIGNQSAFVFGGGMHNFGGSTTQGVGIVKSLSDPYQYYVFVIDALEIYASMHILPKLRYHIVDMSLNGGLGDVVVTTKNIMIDDDIAERMVITHAADCNFWLIVQGETVAEYRAFKITSEGVSYDPVISPGLEPAPFQLGYYGFGCTQLIGEMKMSPDNTVIANVNWDASGSYIQIADFDSLTGQVGNVQALELTEAGAWHAFSIYNTYGLSFSPDGSKLYATTATGLHQYNMALYPDVQAMEGNKVTILPIVYDTIPGALYDIYYEHHLIPGASRIGPDGKIYLQRTDNRIATINYPNLLGAACDFDSIALTEPAFAGHYYIPEHYGYGIGLHTTAPQPPDTATRKVDTVICFQDSVVLSGLPESYQYIWNNASRDPQITVREDGMYWVRSYKDCLVQIDTYFVSLVKASVELGNDTTICPGDYIVLEADIPDAHFEWQDGSTASSYTVTVPGMYRITVNEKGCYYADTVIIAMYEGMVNIDQDDTLICEGDRIILEGYASPEGDFRWSTGEVGNYIEVTTEGIYSVAVEGVCGLMVDSIRIQVQDCSCRPSIPNAFTPNSDGLNDKFGVILNCFPSKMRFSIYNRFGQRVFVSYKLEDAWDGTFGGDKCDMGTYFYQVQYTTPNGEPMYYKGDLLLIR